MMYVLGKNYLQNYAYDTVFLLIYIFIETLSQCYNSLSIFQFSEIDNIVSVIVFFLESRNYHESKFKKNISYTNNNLYI